MTCVSGDEVHVAIHRREDIVRWLRKLDHEGSTWAVEDVENNERDITADIEQECRS
jgi:hypothetical protein